MNGISITGKKKLNRWGRHLRHKAKTREGEWGRFISTENEKIRTVRRNTKNNCGGLLLRRRTKVLNLRLQERKKKKKPRFCRVLEKISRE